ncbi:MAG: hypothetical protein ACREVN_09405 [Gammaproteobacteria bacterium]
MKRLRQHQRLWLLFIGLLAGSLHVQAVYACTETGERLQTACCCEDIAEAPCGEVQPCEPAHSSVRACCEISSSASVGDGSPAAGSSQPLKSGPMPLALPPPEWPLLAAGRGISILATAALSDSPPAASIYLTTRRLRI